MEGILRTRITIDEQTGKPTKDKGNLTDLFSKNIKRKDIINFFKEIAEVVNDIDD